MSQKEKAKRNFNFFLAYYLAKRHQKKIKK
jgi:hypothetical protein